MWSINVIVVLLSFCLCGLFTFSPDAVKRKILVLDLDETLIHSHHDGVLRPTVRPGTPPDFILKVHTHTHTMAQGSVGIYFSPKNLYFSI